jgi:LDH2 family malate/lactate/ureidoglycolate dehydrogenase
MIVDYATTVVSGSKVLMAHGEKKRIPPGWIVDAEGGETTDPGLLADGSGAHLPFGGHKGYAIMLADEFLGRVLSGADAYAETEHGGTFMRHQGVTFIVMRADMFQPMADFSRVSDELQSQIRGVPPAPGFDEVMVPGDPEARARAERSRNGIPLTDVGWKTLTDLAQELGVEVG